MRPIRTFNVTPALPQRLEALRTLAYNLHWDWDVEMLDLFRRLDGDLWESSRYNPVLMLGTISQARLNEIAEDEGFLAQMDRAAQRLEDYLRDRNWYKKHRKSPASGECYAYFSMEFGLTTCMPVYSGGLGVLAGDHLKSASDLGLPLVAIGLLYQEGYFAQYLNADGWQQERYPINDFYNMPLHLERDANGQEIRIEVEYPGRVVYARVWRVQVGTVPLYLLDTNIEPNSQYDQDICDRLYGGDIDMRIHQEVMLGIGGIRMLRALGLTPTAYHMNEGHSAFMALERMRVLVEEQGLTFAEALQVAQASQMFTTHTPVPAGIDLFPPEKVLHYLRHYRERFGLGDAEFLALGRTDTGDFSAPFSMAVLAIKTATFINGVSKLHAEVSRDMFGELWMELPQSEVPITAITNGVHARSCVARSTQALYDRYLGPNWAEASPGASLWERVYAIPDDELWRNHEQCRSHLVVTVRDRLAKSTRDRGGSTRELTEAQECLDPFVLTIGFARRFATYKRATLFLHDLERIRNIINGNGGDRRVQFVIAGKAHPKDIPGKELIRSIIHFTRDQGLSKSIVFVPNYDIHLSRDMVAGCDVWLNNPRRPREASGTSGMKAAMNGLPNLSVLDGWWDEADYIRTGWPIGHGEDYDDPDYQDDVEANALYDILEKEVVPLFYDRDKDEIPRGWVAKMKEAIYFNTPQFNTARMVKDYANLGYFAASDRASTLASESYSPGKELATWQARMADHWYEVRFEEVAISDTTNLQVNQPFKVTAAIQLGALTPDDVQVELYQGTVSVDGEIHSGVAVPMAHQGPDANGRSIYALEMEYTASGLQGLSLRILPRHRYLNSPYDPKLVLWADPDSVRIVSGVVTPTAALV
ncbi:MULTISPECIES: alpha-glucan family phosphorylase [Cyanophyceae]|uniref:alpha-glucan family phosphorylase n=1 Tax=Cyanophyceae TaxID=3028117 RepID=UPI001688B401|nr:MULTISPECIES: alpha-glucan family phosphorylase [Cyanophyceae]MBD1914855.1 alpha-glucan family phosphorylase [Phormidium sp. FACHB-77]MBD2031019.1 alpha-glucan family phosphorylase [Phormidium sp. FACHB-322]MBD2052626.1 alpha-glucan family phosphorylase [Leptolyngbya sp. FACHB-60]